VTTTPHVFEGIKGLSVKQVAATIVPGSPSRNLIAWFYHQLAFARVLRESGLDVLLYPMHSEGLLLPVPIPEVTIVTDMIPLIYPKDFRVTSLMAKFGLAPSIRRFPKTRDRM
jgi:hypothetical protein